ncbi:MAG TPA: polyamine aminopropyltransferase [Desulfomonilaceae bacterium]|nr:polyamine aminopropyltransferase [Desulfomonilaceae bacterium]
MKDRFPGVFLLAAVFVVATCGLVYELLAASVSSYLLGGSVTQFSVVIGVFLTAMGIGSYLTRFLEEHLADAFIGIQIAIGLSGGFSAAILLLTFALLPTYLPMLIGVLTVTGSLVGMEIPILIRILRSQEALRLTVANVLALDYLGALIASVAFPVVLVPYLGLLRTSFLFGLTNVAVAAVGLRVMGGMLRKRNLLAKMAGICAVLLVAGLAGSGFVTSWTESILYQDNIILARQTPHQRIVVTKWHNDLRLYLDGHLQFSSVDEYRYHEPLVHPAMSVSPSARRALILGGGDGMTARELLKYPQLESIDLVDLDAELVRLFRERQVLAALSDSALTNPKVRIHHHDAGKFLESSSDVWDVIIADLPDPNSLSLGRLYTTSFYRLVSQHLAAGGIFVTQATSPFYAPEAFWCIGQTIGQALAGPEGMERLNVYPYHAYVPSFGDWGFVMASFRNIDTRNVLLRNDVPFRFLTQEILPSLFTFPKDTLARSSVQPNRIDDQILVNYYRRAWKKFSQ